MRRNILWLCALFIKPFPWLSSCLLWSLLLSWLGSPSSQTAKLVSKLRTEHLVLSAFFSLVLTRTPRVPKLASCSHELQVSIFPVGCVLSVMLWTGSVSDFWAICIFKYFHRFCQLNIFHMEAWKRKKLQNRQLLRGTDWRFSDWFPQSIHTLWCLLLCVLVCCLLGVRCDILKHRVDPSAEICKIHLKINTWYALLTPVSPGSGVYTRVHVCIQVHIHVGFVCSVPVGVRSQCWVSSLSLSTLSLESGSLIKPETRWFDEWAGDLAGELRGSPWPPCWGNRYLAPCWASAWVLEIWVQIVMIEQQAFHPLNHLYQSPVLPPLVYPHHWDTKLWEAFLTCPYHSHRVANLSPNM